MLRTKEDVLREYYGYDTFRDGQGELIDGVLAGRDAVGIMPTGAGKSVCYQVPALMLPGITLVVSPLISLMKDQVRALNDMGIHAAYFNSSLTVGQYAMALQRARQGRYKIIYVAPERLLTDRFLELSMEIPVSFLAVDEAHCISQWGQDFRPAYLRITEFVERLPSRPAVAAFTATATEKVRKDVEELLKLREPVVVTTGFDRSNLYFEVKRDVDKYRTVRDYLSGRTGDSGIIYCNTRKQVDELYDKLSREGFPVTRYHAGLGDAERKNNQDDFIFDRSPVMIATNAFGMGIDKSNVRFVLHYNMPKDMESYYQEAGRAGRDGEPADCILLYGGQDVVTGQFFIEKERENKELDSGELMLIRERDRERLKRMTFYCHSTDCLREYILGYFGERSPAYCGNCGNCLTKFETADVTEAAVSLIGCVRSCRQRYGTTVIVDAVHGANTVKIRQYRMNENPYYAQQAAMPVYRLRRIMNHLLLNGYLYLTDDEYPVVKLGERAAAVLGGEETVTMKIAVGEERPKKEKKVKSRASDKTGGVVLSAEDSALFDRLRELRMEIARREKVPPYIVFSDKTLIYMSVLRPGTKEAMLKIPGVGEYKFEKYGEQFIHCIPEETGEADRDRPAEIHG